MNNSRIFTIARAVTLLFIVTTATSRAQDNQPGWNAARPDRQGKPGEPGKPQKSGKPMMRTMKFDADKAVMIDEAGMVVTEKDGKLTVEFIPPKDRRPKDTAELDVMEGDEIGMAGGKRMSSAKTLRDAYESVKPGEEFKLGLRRDGRAFIVSFTRKDGKDLPKRMIIRTDGDDSPDGDVLPALGIAIKAGDGKLVITETFPNAPDEMLQGDVIHSINGTTVKTLDEFSRVYDNAEIGAMLRFGLLRDGKPVTVVTERKKPMGKMIVK
jgi:S1-C subfamily serine protease